MHIYAPTEILTRDLPGFTDERHEAFDHSGSAQRWAVFPENSSEPARSQAQGLQGAFIPRCVSRKSTSQRQPGSEISTITDSGLVWPSTY
jgi:hypothetical protein